MEALGRSVTRWLQQIQTEGHTKLQHLINTYENMNAVTDFVNEETALFNRQYSRIMRMLNRAYFKNAFYVKSLSTSATASFNALG